VSRPRCLRTPEMGRCPLPTSLRRKSQKFSFFFFMSTIESLVFSWCPASFFSAFCPLFVFPQIRNKFFPAPRCWAFQICYPTFWTSFPLHENFDFVSVHYWECRTVAGTTIPFFFWVAGCLRSFRAFPDLISNSRGQKPLVVICGVLFISFFLGRVSFFSRLLSFFRPIRLGKSVSVATASTLGPKGRYPFFPLLFMEDGCLPYFFPPFLPPPPHQPL